jgi:DUF971 family protein
MGRPVDIAHSLGNNALVITWDDGVRSELPIPYLRAWCPCAGCQGHGNEIHHRPVGDDIRAEGLYEMGAYALAIRFSDGHDAGIFSWTWLRQLSPQTEPVGLKRGSFRAGTFIAPPP